MTQINKISLTIILFLSLVFHSCSSKPPNYYRKIDLDGTYEFVGNLPITDEESKTIVTNFKNINIKFS